MHTDHPLNHLWIKLQQMNLMRLSEIVGTLLFLLVFVGVLMWVIGRSRSDIDHWSHLPLDDGKPKEPE